MKNWVLFIAAISSAMIFFSCKKEQVQPQAAIESDESIQGQKLLSPSLKGGLLARYEFDGKLNDLTGNLSDAIPNIIGGEIYTDDRKGNKASAIKFTGRYGLDIQKLPASGSDMSVATWVKYDSPNLSTNYFVKSMTATPEFAQELTDYFGVITTPMTTSVPYGPIDDQWHHLAATYDQTTLKFYVDGKYIGSTVNPFLGGPFPADYTTTYQVGYVTFPYSTTIQSVWYGSVDDLRFYSKILSAKEVAALASL